MLSMATYPKEYVAERRSRVAAQVDAYRRLTATAPNDAGSAFAPVFFNAMVLALDASFVHRARAIEGKDGNALNEVRVLCNSMLLHGDVLTQEKAIKLDPEASVLGIPYGEKIALDETAFTALADAFFDEIEARFVA
jgi:hypothetical protein